jgi:Na+/H+ antiporter NhaA
MLTVVVFDDLVALVVIATVYTETLRVGPLVVAVGCFAAVLGVRRRARTGPRLACSLLGVGAWVALLESGVEPVVIGLAMGLLAHAYPVPRSRLEGRHGALPRVSRAADRRAGARGSRGA